MQNVNNSESDHNDSNDNKDHYDRNDHQDHNDIHDNKSGGTASGNIGNRSRGSGNNLSIHNTHSAIIKTQCHVRYEEKCYKH